jgi:hypothetical protein
MTPLELGWRFGLNPFNVRLTLLRHGLMPRGGTLFVLAGAFKRALEASPPSLRAAQDALRCEPRKNGRAGPAVTPAPPRVPRKPSDKGEGHGNECT